MRATPTPFLAVLVLAACAGAPTEAVPLADTIYRGGTILTMDAEGTRAEAVAVHGRRILTVGTAADVMRTRGPDTEVVDLGGVAVVPGFVEAHGVLLRRADADADVVARASAACATVGWTTIQEGAATPAEVELITGVANAMRLEVDAVVFPVWEGIDELGDELDDMDCVGTLRIGGLAIGAGAPVSDDELRVRVERCFANRWHVHATLRSSAEVDALIRAVRAARAAHDGAPPRVVAIVHTADVTPDQLAAMAELGVVPSFCATNEPPSIGLAAAASAVPGLRFTLHDDDVAALPLPIATLAAAVRGGLAADRAMRALTVDSAWQLRMDGRKGSIEAGKLADLVILSADPTACDARALADVEVLATIKSGKTVYVGGD